MAITKLDPVQIQRMAFDEEVNANRAKLVDTEIAVELSAEDGDSVYAIPVSLTLSEGIHSVVGMKTLCKYGATNISVSPSDEGDNFYVLAITELEPKSICARRVKIEGAGLVVVQSV